MKILMVNKFLYPNGGSETYIFELGKELVRQGHQVEYFGMEHENRIVGNHAESYTQGMDFHTGKLQKVLYPFKIIYSREARKKIKAVLEDFKPDVVHLNNFNFQLTPSIIYEIKAHKIPIVFTAHDPQLVCPNHRMINGRTGQVCEKCLYGSSFNCTKDRCIHGSLVKSFLGTVENTLYRSAKTYKNIDVIISPSEFIGHKLASSSILASKIKVLHNFIPDMENSVPEKEEYVLYFGRYSEEKGLGTLIEVCKKLPEITFVFAGKGELADQAAKVPNIKEIGFLRGKALHDVIRKARFTVVPSECYENCPFSVMESQALGTPVIGADIGGIPELIREGESGEIFQSGNEKALKQTVEMLWNDRGKCLEYAENCKENDFDNLETYTNKIIEIYQKLMVKNQ